MHQIATRSLAEPCIPSMVAYCPSMDLVATVTAQGSVDVWRLNGQRVCGANFSADDDEHDDEGRQEGGGGNVKALGWRSDGQILAVACADGTVSLINVFTGKIAHRISPRAPDSAATSFTSSSSQTQTQHRRRSSKTVSTAPPTSVAPGTRPLGISSASWTTHFSFPSPSVIRSRLDHPDSTVSLDQILALRANVDRLLELKADLPRELSAIDVEVSLPKLATLPPHGVGLDDDVFSSRASVDIVFHGGGSTSSTGVGGVDALLVGLSGETVTGNEKSTCAVHLRIFDSFEIGTVDLSRVLSAQPGQHRVLRIEGHPYLPTVFVLVEQSMTDGSSPPSLHLLSLDLSFIPQTGQNLPLVAKKATQLGNLLRYISQVQTQLAAEVKAAFDLPGRFLRNINEALAEADESADFVYAAHHLTVTGECDPRLKEWLVDEVGDRGLKRWEKAVGDCLDVVRRMASECLLPALERCLVVLSRLDGLAKFGPTSTRLGLDEKGVQRVIETVDALGILTEDLLLDVGIEMREFTAFIKWLKWECEIEALEEGSERAEELRESWTGEGELRMVLDYVGGAMKESRVRKYLATEAQGQDGGLTTSFDDDPDSGFYAEYTKRRAATTKDKRMPTLEALVGRLQKQSEVVFGQVAETFRKSILASYMFELPQACGGKALDMRVIPDQHDESLYRLFALCKDVEHKGSLLQVEVILRQGAGKSVGFTTSSSTTPILDIEEILDAKFVDDTAFLVLGEKAEEVALYRHTVLGQNEQPAWELQHVFEEGRMDAGMKPAMLEVNGRTGRRAVTVVDETGTGFVVLDLDTGVDGVHVDDEIMTG